MKLRSKSVMLLVVGFLAVTTQRLPAPIQEVPESPTPAPEQSAKPKPKRPVKPKARSESSETSTKRQTPSPTLKTQATSTSTSTASPTPSKKFAGKWSGVMPEVPWGNVQTELIVDPTETIIEWQESGKHKGSAKTQLNGDTLLARVAIGFTTAVWFITPSPDGATANIRMTAFMNDDHAVFRRTSP